MYILDKCKHVKNGQISKWKKVETPDVIYRKDWINIKMVKSSDTWCHISLCWSRNLDAEAWGLRRCCSRGWTNRQMRESKIHQGAHSCLKNSQLINFKLESRSLFLHRFSRPPPRRTSRRFCFWPCQRQQTNRPSPHPEQRHRSPPGWSQNWEIGIFCYYF